MPGFKISIGAYVAARLSGSDTNPVHLWVFVPLLPAAMLVQLLDGSYQLPRALVECRVLWCLICGVSRSVFSSSVGIQPSKNGRRREAMLFEFPHQS